MSHFPNCSLSFFVIIISDDNIDETYGVNVQFESDEEVSDNRPNLFFLFFFFFPPIIEMRGQLLV